MNYELAKKLKEAGFNQKVETISHFYVGEGRIGYMTSDSKVDPLTHQDDFKLDWCKIPTLSELIEACGGRFGCVARLEDGTYQAWDSYELNYDPENCSADILVGRSYCKHDYCPGSTPEEAVANLRLALNKK